MFTEKGNVVRMKTGKLVTTVLLIASICGWSRFSTSTSFAETLPFDASFTFFGQPTTVSFKLWLPDDTPHLRGLVIMSPGGTGVGDTRDEADELQWQQAAASFDFGIVGMSSVGLTSPDFEGFRWGDPLTSETAQNLQSTLDAAAAESVHPELSNVPIVAYGHSGGGSNSVFLAAMVPSRTIAFVSLRGFAPEFDLSDEAKQVPGVFIGGSLDQNVAKVYDRFLSYRSQNAQVAFAVDWGGQHNLAAHADRRRFVGGTSEMGWSWLSEAIRLRYPQDELPSFIPGEPLVLNDIDTKSGWLGEAATFVENDIGFDIAVNASPFAIISPAGSFVDDSAVASWLPNEAAANVYRASTSIDPNRLIAGRDGLFLGGPLEFVSPSRPFLSRSIPVFYVGDEIDMLVEPHEFDDVHAITEMQFFDGDKLIGVDTVGPEWGAMFQPDHAGIHGLVVVATDELGNRTSSFRAVIVHPIPEPSALAIILLGLAIITAPGQSRRRRRWLCSI